MNYISNNNDICPIIKRKYISIRRLCNELQIYYPILIDETQCHYNYDDYKISVYFNHKYPFTPPTQIRINDTEINYTSVPSRLINYYTNVCGHSCPQCSSYLRKCSWKPACTIEQVIQQYISFTYNMKNIRNIIHFINVLQILKKLPNEMERIIISYII